MHGMRHRRQIAGTVYGCHSADYPKQAPVLNEYSKPNRPPEDFYPDRIKTKLEVFGALRFRISKTASSPAVTLYLTICFSTSKLICVAANCS